MKLRVNRFRIRRSDAPAPGAEPISVPPMRAAPPQGAPGRPSTAQAAGDMPFAPEAEDDGFGPGMFPTARPRDDQPADTGAASGAGPEIDAIRREALTGRQLRMARRMAEKHNLPATSDFDAVRLLRRAGIDPFEKSAVLKLVAADANPNSRALTTTPGNDDARLPAQMKPMQLPSTETRAENNHVADILRMQQDIARRRRRKSMLLAARLFCFVTLPALVAGWYYYMIATPMFATKSEFVIQQAQPASSPGVGGLLSGTQFATSQDSIAVQGYLQSRDAMLRLDDDLGFKSHFSDESIDPIQRLPADASDEQAYKLYKRNVKIAYDPTEGLIKMEVVAADPAVSEQFSRALISYAEEQVDQLTQRLREDQMQGARDSFQDAETKMLGAQRRVVELQEQYDVLSSEVEVSLITAQIAQLETQLTTEKLSLAQMESNSRPNQARMDPIKRRIDTLELEIATLRSRLTEDDAGGGLSIARVQSELLVAQADVTTRQMMMAQALQQMENARIEANRQVRYLSLSVSPVAPDEATYPRAFENTAVALLIFLGIYLMIAMTAAILREQVTA
jgi:capsular polysaccharide transport system permease protein